jgi:hypothetical protein
MWRTAANASSSAAGQGCSGARRYSTDTTRHAPARAKPLAIESCVSIEPATKPPP